MLATTKNVLFAGHNQMLTTGTDDLTLWLSPKRQQVKGYHSTGGYDLEIRHF